MSERILIYEKDREILTFLKSFFRKRRDFKVEFAPAKLSLTTPFTGQKQREETRALWKQHVGAGSCR